MIFSASKLRATLLGVCSGPVVIILCTSATTLTGTEGCLDCGLSITCVSNYLKDFIKSCTVLIVYGHRFS